MVKVDLAHLVAIADVLTDGDGSTISAGEVVTAEVSNGHVFSAAVYHSIGVVLVNLFGRQFNFFAIYKVFAVGDNRVMVAHNSVYFTNVDLGGVGSVDAGANANHFIISGVTYSTSFSWSKL